KIAQKVQLSKVEARVESKQDVKSEPKPEKSFIPQLGIFKKIASVFTPEVELNEKELTEVFDDLELSLLESDASLETSQFMVSDLRSKVVGKRIAKSKLNDFVNTTVRSVLLDVFSFSTPPEPFFSIVKKNKPFVVMFVGPNGAGKTTTIAKLAHQLKQRNISCVISASDTFRAAAIQQAEHHGEKIGVKVVKHDYGSDPAAVAFDAVSHAKAKNLDVVLIDTAGRQETNVNLIEEMKKISRVVKPDLKIFVGETLAGHSVIEQAKKFNDAIKLDGLILTKLDCDAKGGNALSIAHDLKLPIYFVGLGQEYSELVEFTPQMLVARILAE
ncbi:MAG: signal recognition particle-docking protein FtsY, partial [Candidatus Micrarchaeota archaeon]|nr:signal recognition particle-docking protein FtsY [Candidatus Micrarchaeota archaeon]